jgi:hypothetical protein
MKFNWELFYDEFIEWPCGPDVWEVMAEVVAEGFIKGDNGRRGHPDNWEPPTYNDVEELWVYIGGVEVTNKLTQTAIDRIKHEAWDLYYSNKE